MAFLDVCAIWPKCDHVSLLLSGYTISLFSYNYFCRRFTNVTICNTGIDNVSIIPPHSFTPSFAATYKYSYLFCQFSSASKILDPLSPQNTKTINPSLQHTEAEIYGKTCLYLQVCRRFVVHLGNNCYFLLSTLVLCGQNLKNSCISRKCFSDKTLKVQLYPGFSVLFNIRGKDLCDSVVVWL